MCILQLDQLFFVHNMYNPFTPKFSSAACDLVPQSATTKFRLGFCLYPFYMEDAN